MEVCQRPKRALFISTYIGGRKHDNKRRNCVNALNGLSSFLQNRKGGVYYDNKRVCQRPKRALFISTSPTSILIILFTLGVNALNGLSSFLRKGENMKTYEIFYVSTP